MLGGHSQIRDADEDETAMFVSLKGEVEGRTSEQYSEFEIVGCTSQVVAGTNFWVKVRTNNGHVHVKIFRPLPHTGQPATVNEVHTGQTVDAPFNH